MSRFFFHILLLCTFTALTSCDLSSEVNSTTVSTTEPYVIATAWTAKIVGRLVKEEECIRLNDRDSDVSYLLVWPPDTSSTSSQDTVRVVTGIITGNRQEVVLNIGEMVELGGGETNHLDEQLRQTVPVNCQGPYWVVGTEVGPFDPK